MAVNELTNGASEGTRFGQSTSDKIAHYGGTPVVQRANASQAAAGTTASTTTSPAGYATTTQATAIAVLVNEMRTVLVEQGLMKGSA